MDVANTTAPGQEGQAAVVDARKPKVAERNFHFCDNRHKYLLFVNTCAEKCAVAERIARELPSLRPSPPALRVCDAGVGDGTIPSRVLRSMHHLHDVTRKVLKEHGGLWWDESYSISRRAG